MVWETFRYRQDGRLFGLAYPKQLCTTNWTGKSSKIFKKFQFPSRPLPFRPLCKICLLIVQERSELWVILEEIENDVCPTR